MCRAAAGFMVHNSTFRFVVSTAGCMINPAPSFGFSCVSGFVLLLVVPILAVSVRGINSKREDDNYKTA